MYRQLEKKEKRKMLKTMTYIYLTVQGGLWLVESVNRGKNVAMDDNSLYTTAGKQKKCCDSLMARRRQREVAMKSREKPVE